MPDRKEMITEILKTYGDSYNKLLKLSYYTDQEIYQLYKNGNN